MSAKLEASLNFKNNKGACSFFLRPQSSRETLDFRLSFVDRVAWSDYATESTSYPWLTAKSVLFSYPIHKGIGVRGRYERTSHDTRARRPKAYSDVLRFRFWHG